MLQARARGVSGLGIPSNLASIIAHEKSYVLLNKADLSDRGDFADVNSMLNDLGAPGTWIASLRTGDGLKQFLDDLGGRLREKYSSFLSLRSR